MFSRHDKFTLDARERTDEPRPSVKHCNRNVNLEH